MAAIEADAEEGVVDKIKYSDDIKTFGIEADGKHAYGHLSWKYMIMNENFLTIALVEITHFMRCSPGFFHV